MIREDGRCCWGCKYYSTNDEYGNCSKKKEIVHMNEYCEKYHDLWDVKIKSMRNIKW